MKAKHLNLLKTGGALRHTGTKGFQICHPFHDKPVNVTEEDVRPLMDAGQFVCINCGCTGFWWTFKEVPNA